MQRRAVFRRNSAFSIFGKEKEQKTLKNIGFTRKIYGEIKQRTQFCVIFLRKREWKSPNLEEEQKKES